MNQEMAMKSEIPISMAEKLAQELQDDEFKNYVGQILESKYDKVSPAEVAEAQKHLTREQRKGIESLVSKYYPRLYSGELGVYSGRKIHLEMEPGAIPVHARPYSVARLHLEVFKKELKRLVEIGVLRLCGATNWASPTFDIPKKD
jgi:hypothetical protein